MSSKEVVTLRSGGLPVRGIPFVLLSVGLLGGIVGLFLQKIAGIVISWVFVYPIVLSNPVGMRLGGRRLTLLYGFGLIRQNIFLDSIQEISFLSRLEYATITRHFKAYATLWLIVVFLSILYLLTGENPIGLYFSILFISLYGVFFLVLTFPRRRDALYVGALLAIIFLIIYPLLRFGPKTLLPGFIFALFIIWLVKGFQRDELILLVADGKSYLLTVKNAREFLELLRGEIDAQAP